MPTVLYSCLPVRLMPAGRYTGRARHSVTPTPSKAILPYSGTNLERRLLRGKNYVESPPLSMISCSNFPKSFRGSWPGPRVGSRGLADLAGPVGSGQEVFQISRAGSGWVRRFSNFMGPVRPPWTRPDPTREMRSVP